jgi:hypothetical protein
MISIKNKRSVHETRIRFKRIFTVSLSITLMLFVYNMSPLAALNTASAAELTRVSVTPASNVINEKATYSFFITTATTATINKIEISFPSSFDISGIRLIERSNIGSGSLSVTGSILTYTPDNPESVSAGTTIKLEIGRIVATTEGSFTVSVKTLNSAGGAIDGPTESGPFMIKSIGTNDILDNKVSSSDIKDNSITGSDISTAFMIQKTLHDDTVGNTRGWNPDGFKKAFAIADDDISSAPNSQFVSMMIRSENAVFCSAAGADTGLFVVYCNSAPKNSADINYIITKLPSHDVTSSLSASSESTPSSVSPPTSSSPHMSTLPDIDSINRQDETSSEFP